MSYAELVRASAGTGKTFRLVETYVRFVLEDRVKPSSVVAITFTRKAARELVSRIRTRLGVEARDELAMELSRAPINNFHGLALQLLTMAGVEIGMPGHIAVLAQEGDDRRLFAQACEDAWLGEATTVSASVAALAVGFNIDRDLPVALWDVLARAREDARVISGRELVAGYDVDMVRGQLAVRAAGLRVALAAARLLMSPASCAKIEQFLQGTPSDDGEGDPTAWADAWARAAGRLDRRGKLGEVLTTADLDFLRLKMHSFMHAEGACVALAPHVACLLDAAWSRYMQLKAERRVVDFAELVERAVALLEGDAQLHARVLRRFRAVLVDEAQDTNRLQRRFVRLLAGLDGPAAGSEPPAALFVVGDRKQAIYTFRGADPESFDCFAADVTGLDGLQETLTTSYRATPSLCAMVNHLGQTLFEAEYEPITAASTMVEAPPTAAMVATAARWVETPTGASAAASTLLEAAAVADFVAERVAAGQTPGQFSVLLTAIAHAPHYCAALQARGVAATVGAGGLYAQREIIDLAALVRWGADPDDRLAAAVALRSPLFGLSDSGLLRVFRPASAKDWVTTFTDSGVTRLGHDLGGDDAEALSLAARAMPRLWRAAGLLSADAWLRLCFDLLDIEELLLALPGGEQRRANGRRLLTLAADFGAANGGDIRRFARELSWRMDSGARESLATSAGAAGGAEAGAVAIGTIHQAKGLEFPVVLLADLSHGAPGDRASLRYARGPGVLLRPRIDGEGLASLAWDAAAHEACAGAKRELARLLYVAVTRAERELVFFAPAAVKPASRGLMCFLGPWRDQAARDGVLQIVAAPRAASTSSARVVPSVLVEEASRDGGRMREQAHTSSTPTPTPTPTLSASPSPLPLSVPEGSAFFLSVTELEAFLQCRRRGALRSRLRLQEVGHPWMPTLRDGVDEQLDPTVRGRLVHAVLARLDLQVPSSDLTGWVDAGLAALGYELGDPRLRDLVRDSVRFLASPLGRRLCGLSRTERRHELPFTTVFDAASFRVVLTGQIDVLYADQGSPVVLDFKHARPDAAGLKSYELQLEAYAQAVSRMCDIGGSVRTQLVFLKSGEVIEHGVTAAMRQAFTARVAAVVDELARWHGQGEPWPGQPLPVCRELGCGFIEHCHGRGT